VQANNSINTDGQLAHGVNTALRLSRQLCWAPGSRHQCAET